MGFVHLHNHSTYSLRDGFCSPESYVEGALALGMSAIAITDHGNIFSAINLCEAAQKHNINGIIGSEIYVSAQDAKTKDKSNKENFHLTLLVKNKEGYHNLCQILTWAATEGYYYSPRVDKEVLKKYSGGLIAMSGCLKGEVPNAILKGDFERAAGLLKEYSDIFGKDYYVEIMDANFEGQEKVNKHLIPTAKAAGLKLVATNDCHYINKIQAEAQKVMMAIGMGKTLSELRFETTGENYLKTEDDMRSALSKYDYIDEMIANTEKIAARCDFKFEFEKHHIPKFENLTDKQAIGKLRMLCREGWKKKIKPVILKREDIDRYSSRVKYELGVIEKYNFMHYFLMVWDVMQYYEKHGIMKSPGRGSVGGSLAAYLLDITDIDPLKYGLIFERFLNPGRFEKEGGGLPDIDIDVPDDRRQEVIDYVKQKWGEDKVIPIATFGTLGTRGALKAVSKAFGVDFKLVNSRITSLIPKREDCSLKDYIYGNEAKKVKPIPELQAYAREYPKMFEMAMALEGSVDRAGRHASGIIISDEPISSLAPVCRMRGNELACAYDMYDSKKIGLVQMDFLGLTELSIVTNILKDVKEYHGKEIDLERLPLDDEKTWETIASGDTYGVFQFSSRFIRDDILKKAKPRNLKDLAACNAIARPGNYDAGTHLNYIARKHGMEDISYIYPTLSTVLEGTYGILVYQEQSMRIAVELAGFSLAEADLLRKAIGKKKSEMFPVIEKMFFDGAAKKGVPEETIKEVWTLINYMSRYSFVHAHAIGYSLLAYRTAWLKTHYPLQYYYAQFKFEHDDRKKIAEIVRECYFKNIKINPPDLSFDPAKRNDNELMLPFVALKNVGEGTASYMWEQLPFKSLTDFIERIDYSIVTEAAIKPLIACGAFESLTNYRWEILDLYRAKRKSGAKQVGLFGASSPEGKTEPRKIDLSQKVDEEREVLGFNLRYSLLQNYSDYLKNDCQYSPVDLLNKGVLREEEIISVGGVIEEARVHIDKKGKKMVFCTLTDDHCFIPCVIFSSLYEDEHLQDLGLWDGMVVKFKGKWVRGDRGNSFLVSDAVRARANK